MIKKLGKGGLMISIIATVVFYTLEWNSSNVLGSNYINKKEPNSVTPIKVVGLVHSIDDPFIAKVRKNLADIILQNQDNVDLEFYYTMADHHIEMQTLNSILQQDVDLIIIQLADITKSESVVNNIKQTNIPVVFFNREPISLVPIRSYNKSLYIGTEGREAGVLQGIILINEWNTKKKIIDKNIDGVLQYIMLTGDKNNKEAIERTKYSILTVNEAGIKTEELALRVINWNRKLARDATRSLLLRHGNNIEAVIANNDSIAIGAIETLQEFGYNKGDGREIIPVVGVDAVDEAKELIAKGFMAGTIIQDDYEMAKAIYLTGMNFIYGRNPLEGTNYEFDGTGVSIRIPYKEYIKN